MKNLNSYFVLFCLLLSIEVARGQNTSPDKETFFPIKAGTNIAHWLSQSNKRGATRKAFFTQKDVKYIAKQGFDHVRLPVDEVQLFDENGNRDKEAFELLHNAIKWCNTAQLKVIVDLHIIRTHHFNAKENALWTENSAQESFLKIWQKLSDELGEYPKQWLAYELMNEPVAKDDEDWNKLIAKTVKRIREKEPQRTLIIGSNSWQSVHTFQHLKVPKDDPYIGLSFHFYTPFLLTHYQASWTNIASYNGNVHYPGEILEDSEILSAEFKEMLKPYQGTYNLEVLTGLIQKAILVAKELNLPLYCGEWGVINNAPQIERLRWYKDMLQIFNSNNIAHANWNYKSDNFGLLTNDGKVNKSLVKIVSPRYRKISRIKK